MDASEGDADVTTIKPLRRSNTTSLQIEYLWDQAVKHLSEDDRQQVDFSPDDKREALPEILAVVETEKTLMKGREWKLGKRSNGEPIVLRDVLGKIANWIDKLKEVGDNAANFDPVHAALPWAAVRFVLQVHGCAAVRIRNPRKYRTGSTRPDCVSLTGSRQRDSYL